MSCIMTERNDNPTESSLRHRLKRLSIANAQADSVVSSSWQIRHQTPAQPNSNNSEDSICRLLASLIARRIASDLQVLPEGSELPGVRGLPGG
ncbi:MAG: hypothetical protein JKX85_02525, partial [Phycisphaeraceae bacterium]|nr:hypothetical protein [Phycisphaeraceae bacterium]